MLVRYAFISSNDDTVTLFAPRMGMPKPPYKAESYKVSKAAFAEIFLKMLREDHPDVMPQTITGLGLSFGVMSETAWGDLVALVKKYGGKEVV